MCYSTCVQYVVVAVLLMCYSTCVKYVVVAVLLMCYSTCVQYVVVAVLLMCYSTCVQYVVVAVLLMCYSTSVQYVVVDFSRWSYWVHALDPPVLEVAHLRSLVVEARRTCRFTDTRCHTLGSVVLCDRIGQLGHEGHE